MTAPQPPRDLLIRVLIPAAVALIFIAVLVSERGSATRDLQLLAPVRAAPGQPLPLRAYLFDLREEIPRALAEPVALRLEDEGGTVLAETRLEPVGEPPRMEGVILLPEEAGLGTHRLVAHAHVGEREVRVARRLEVEAAPAAPARRGRLQTDLQRWALEEVSGVAPPSELDARVVGGDCSIPVACELLVWVGEPAAGVSIGESAAVEPEQRGPGVEGEGEAATEGARAPAEAEAAAEAEARARAPARASAEAEARAEAEAEAAAAAPAPAEAEAGGRAPAEAEARARASASAEEEAPAEARAGARATIDAGAVARAEDGADPTECDATPASVGVLRCPLHATGNEAVAELHAWRHGVPVGTRRVRLPMGLAAPAIRLARSEATAADARTETTEPALLPPGARPLLQVTPRYPDRSTVVVDLFHEGQWVHTATRAPAAAPLARPLDRPGLWRVEVRRDPFATDHAAVRLLFVHPAADTDPAAALDALARHPRQGEWADPLALRLRDGPLECPVGCAPDRLARFLLAAGELELVVPPHATSGAAQENVGLHDVQSGRRRWAAALIVLAGLFVAVVVVRRGRMASREARQLLAAAHEGDDTPPPPARRALAPWGYGALVWAAFGVVALLVLSRGCL
ncbi:MAG: hypothetical protein CMN31_15960 [Sandaracinus sp.]|nr:hypothetical protein [Sandaracinus sp.]